MKVKLKICGMREPANILQAATLLPDYMGFIFYDQSPRYVNENVKLPALPDSIKRVGVFVNEQTEAIIRMVHAYQLNFVQLHGNESERECEKLKARGFDVIKVFSVDEYFDFERVKSYRNYVRYFLFDTKGQYFGGNAKTFDWKLLLKYDQVTPFFLSGGITVDTISAVQEINTLNIHALDVNSGVEISPGIKDIKKINELKRVVSTL